HFFSIWVDSYGSQSSQSSVNPPPKAMYAELSGLSKKAINSAIRADMQNLTDDINNPVVTKHKERPLKRCMAAGVERKTQQIFQKAENVGGASNMTIT
ncbi:6333_t:CDS:2, partial [Funneliformis geosporum]